MVTRFSNKIKIKIKLIIQYLSFMSSFNYYFLNVTLDKVSFIYYFINVTLDTVSLIHKNKYIYIYFKGDGIQIIFKKKKKKKYE